MDFLSLRIGKIVDYVQGKPIKKHYQDHLIPVDRYVESRFSTPPFKLVLNAACPNHAEVGDNSTSPPNPISANTVPLLSEKVSLAKVISHESNVSMYRLASP